MSENSEAKELRKVLIVDDDEFLVNMYTLKFQKKGIEVVTAQKGGEGLNKLREEGDVDVVLLDVIMPDMDGLEVLETIKKEGLDENCAVIMLTNQSTSKDIEKAKELGVDRYIIKAVSVPSEVVEEVERVFRYYDHSSGDSSE